MKIQIRDLPAEIVKRENDIKSILKLISNQADVIASKNKKLTAELELNSVADLNKINELTDKIEDYEERLAKSQETIHNLRDKLKNLKQKKSLDDIDSEVDKNFIKFVNNKLSHSNNPAVFIEKIDKMVKEIELCIEFLNEI